MDGGTDSGLRLRALLAELEDRARHETACADELAASAWDQARWGLAVEAGELRRWVRRRRVLPLLYDAQAVACRARIDRVRRPEA